MLDFAGLQLIELNSPPLHRIAFDSLGWTDVNRSRLQNRFDSIGFSWIRLDWTDWLGLDSLKLQIRPDWIEFVRLNQIRFLEIADSVGLDWIRSNSIGLNQIRFSKVANSIGFSWI